MIDSYPDAYDESEETGIEVAVIGMSGRFPGAANIKEFWENLKNGVESIAFFTDQELLETGLHPSWLGANNFIKARGYLDKVEYFDAAFFGYTPAEATIMDPQLRFFQECAWEAFEDSGTEPESYNGTIGVFFGSSDNMEWKFRVETIGQGGGNFFSDSLLRKTDLIATRLSYQLNLTGPSTTVNAACSTSLVAIHMSVRALLSGECDMALAGGVSITVPQKRGYRYNEGMIQSPDGHCRAFDIDAGGTVFGSGIGVVILKRLDDAREDGNHIYAVIKGSAMNNDGKRKVGYTAPGIDGQSEVIRAALQVADVDPDSVGYIETHGTGTILGDQVEIKALHRAMDRQSSRPIPIGAVKTNIGHLDAAAGVAGFIKTVLCLKHRLIPATLHFKTPNPEMENTPFYVNNKTIRWERENRSPLRAGVSAFGIGGTNVHIILEEAPPVVVPDDQSDDDSHQSGRCHQLILLSAKTPSALDKISENLADYLLKYRQSRSTRQGTAQPLDIPPDVAYTLQVGRKDFVYRKAVVCKTVDEAIQALGSPGDQRAMTAISNEKFPHTVFMFAGQGSQYVEMGRELYRQEPVFREEMDRCFEILNRITKLDLKTVLYPSLSGISPNPNQDINRTENAQPIIFSLEYALAKQLMHWGIVPDAMIGYSFGEYAAACLAGVFSLEDALELISSRGSMMQQHTNGAMLSVPLPEQELIPLLEEGVSIAIVNEPACIVAGEADSIEKFENKMKQRKLMCMRLKLDFAPHTAGMENSEAIREFEAKLDKIQLQEPDTPLVSGITGDWLEPAEAARHRYWNRHLKETVRFSAGIRRLLEEKKSIFIEIGPGRDLTVLARRYINKDNPQPIIDTIRSAGKNQSDVAYLLRQLGRLWIYRMDIDWEAFHDGSEQERRLLPLPTYPFESKKYWIDEEKYNEFARYLLNFKYGNNVSTGTEKKTEPEHKVEVQESQKKVIPNTVITKNAVTENDVKKQTGATEEKPVRDVHPRPQLDTPYTAPENDTQQQTARIWQEFFGLDRVGVDDDFFDLGGDSLKATVVLSRMHKEQGIKVSLVQLFDNPTIRQLTQTFGDDDSMETFISIEPAEKKEYYDLTPAQHRFYVIQQLNPGSTTFNNLNIIPLAKSADIELLENTFKQLILRHDALRTSFEIINGKPVQRVHDILDFRIGKRTLKSHGEELTEDEIKEKNGKKGDGQVNEKNTKEKSPINSSTELPRVIAEFVRPFDVAKAPLLRAEIVAIDDGMQLLFIDIHHLISDGTTHQVLRKDFEALLTGKALEPLTLQYKDFSCWLNDSIRSGRMEKHEKYWLQQLGGELPVMELPTDFARPAARRIEGKRFIINLGVSLTEKLYQKARRTETTLYMVLLAAFSILLSRITGQQDILVGSPIAARYHSDLENLIGLVIGGVVMRSRPNPLKSFTQFLEEVKHTTLEAYEHQAFPLEELLKRVRWQERPGHDHIIDVALVLQNYLDNSFNNANYDNGNGNAGGSKEVKPGKHLPATSKLDLSIYVVENQQSGDIDLTFEYGTALFKPQTIERLADQYRNVLKEITDKTDPLLSDIDFIGIQEKERLTGTVPAFYDLSHPQKRFYYTEKAYPGIGYNTILFTVRYKEILNREVLEKAIDNVIRKNDAMRLRILEIEKHREPLQYIAPHTPLVLEEKSLQWVEEDFKNPPEPVNSPLYYFAYVRYDENHTGYYMKLHHIITDGRSVTLIFSQITAEYDALTASTPAAAAVKDRGLVMDITDTVAHLPKEKNQYPSYLEFLRYEKEYLRSPDAENDRTFWRNYLLPLPEKVQLTKRSPASVKMNPAVKGTVMEVPGDVRTALHNARRQYGTSIYKLILSALSLYIARITGKEEAVVAAATHNRKKPEQWDIMGTFVGTFPVRIKTNRDMTFRDFVDGNGKELNIILKNHGRYPFDKVLEEIRRETGIDPIYLLDVTLLGHQEVPEARYTYNRQFPSYDPSPLTIHINLSNRDKDGVLELQWHYQPVAFDLEDVRQLHRSLCAVLNDALNHPEKKLPEIQLLTEEEKEQILFSFNDLRLNDTRKEKRYPQDKSVYRLIEDIALRHPDHVAVTAPAEEKGSVVSVTYRQLMERSLHLSEDLKAKGIRPGEIVAITIEPSIEMIVAILGTMTAGAVYLPIDTEIPPERIEYILSDSAARARLTAAPQPGNSVDVEIIGGSGICSAVETGISYSPANQCYIIYTSGSTGRPKGVVVNHGNLLAYLEAFGKEFELRSYDVVIQQASCGFDAFVEELYPVLLAGGRLAVPLRRDVRDVERLKRYILEQHVTMITCSPQLLNELNRGFTGSPIRIYISGGDRLKASHVAQLVNRGNAVVYNTYGPTEGTVCASYYRCKTGDPENVPIGKPITNYSLYILDRHRQPLPVGIPGELCIGGPGVAVGYLNNPEMTVEKFLEPQDSHTVGSQEQTKISMSSLLSVARIYKTGDLACWLPDGSIEFLGRIDRQVKVRGYRIELGEIENRINEHPGVLENVVVDKTDGRGDVYLCAYIVPDSSKAEESFDPSSLKETLSRHLPGYMVPSRFALIESIPLTASGKVDARALPEPGLQSGSGYAAPRDHLESVLESLWQQVLAVEKNKIGLDGNFFELGGHSLKATNLISIIHRELEVQVPLGELFGAPTVREMARYIREADRSRFLSIQPAERREYYPLSSAQRRLYLLQQMQPEDTFYNMHYVVPLGNGASVEKLENALKKLIDRHEVLRTSFETVNEEPVQRIHRDVDITCQYYEMPPEQAIREFRRPFDMSQPPLMRMGVIKTFDDGGETPYYTLMLDLHHIVTDGTSQGILIREFITLLSNPDAQLPPLRLQYKDFSQWQNSELQREEVQKQKEYWLKEFSGELPALQLPTDFPRPEVQRFDGNQVYFILDEEETAILKEIVHQHDSTLYQVLLAVFNHLFSKLSGQEDIILGTPVAARRHADLQGVVGMLVNTLAMRNYPTPGKTFSAFLEEIKQRTLDAYENQEFHFEELVENLAIPRDTSRNPVFDVMVNLLNQTEYTGDVPQLDENTPEISAHHLNTSRFDMSWSAVDFDRYIRFTLEYSTALFKPATMERYIKYLKNSIQFLRVPENRERPLAEIPILTEKETEDILQLSRGDDVPQGEIGTLHRLFEQRVEQNPDSTALVYEGHHVTYRQLNCRANRLARYLREKSNGKTAGSIVGVMLERSIEMVTAILAILKTGAAYLPIDPGYPEQRIKVMLEDSGVSTVITDGKQLGRISITAYKKMEASKENLVKTPPRPQIKNFDTLPLPDRSLIDYSRYHRYIGEAPATDTITMQATRGCPFNCIYCHKIWPKTHVARSAENIFEEILRAHDAGLRRFVFIDDIFNLDHKNASRVLDSIIDRDMDLQLFFPNGFRADILTKDFIDRMMAAGTVNLDVALESASPRIQRLIGKNLDLDKFGENVTYITEKYPHVVLEMEMMHGFPTETEEEARKTLEYLKQFRWVHFPNLHVLKIFPNTDMCRLAVENGISEALIRRCADQAFHELPDTLPFPKQFTRNIQAQFMADYFLSKERLKSVLPHQLNVLTEDELVQKYDSYLSFEVKQFSDILEYAGITRQEMGEYDVIPGDHYRVPDFKVAMRKYSPRKKPAADAFRLLLLDLSQLFTEENEHMLHHQIEEPLGLLYLMSYLNERFGEKIDGKVMKSRIDFDGFEELRTVLNQFKPDMIGIRTLSFYKEFFHKTVMMIRQWGWGVPIVAGGPYATSDYDLILQDPDVDAVVLGEGEITLAELVETVMDNGKRMPREDRLSKVPGIVFAKDCAKAETKTRGSELILLDQITGKLDRYDSGNLMELETGYRDLLYVIYTSGSTGKPKGIMLEHGNLVNLIRHQYAEGDIDFSRVLQFTTISFDVSAQEIFSTLLAGGRLTLVSKETLGDVPRLLQEMEKEKLKTMFVPASFLKFVMGEEEYAPLMPSSLDHIVTAGEQLVVNRSLKRYIKTENVRLHNHYGPAETHVVTTYTIDPSGDIPTIPPIGKPVQNTAIYIVDKGKNPVPAGVPGELIIEGAQVGRGYLNQIRLTEENFLPARRAIKSFCRGSRGAVFSEKSPPGRRRQTYKTGDLARRMADGNIEFLGRIDQQVKIRGFRIEPGEIENRLMEIPGVKEAVVQDREEPAGGRYLCAYVVANRCEDIDTEELRTRLAGDLPDYMVPSYIMTIDAVPLTPSGKINRRGLPEPGVTVGDDFVPPATPEEKKLAEIWAGVLGLEKERIGIRENFFALGGHSLRASIVITRIHKEFNVKVPLLELFKTPTVEQLAQYIAGNGQDSYEEIKPAERSDYYPLTSAQMRLYVLQEMEPGNTNYNMPFMVPLPVDVEKERLEEIFNTLIQRHEILRTAFITVGEDDVPVQTIRETVEFRLDEIDGIPGYDRDQTGDTVPEALTERFKKPFDLSEAPLMRAALIKTEPGSTAHCWMMVDMHHIITDGTSQEILKRDFSALFNGESLQPLKLQYRDFARWENSPRQREKVEAHKTYWLKEFSGELPVLMLPTDYPRPQVQSFRGNTVHFILNPAETAILEDIGREQEVTPYMVMMSVLTQLLARLSGQEDIILGTPVAARRHADLQGVVGMFVNTLAIRNYPVAETTYIDFLRDVKLRTLGAFENQEYNFEELVEQVELERDVSRNPLFDVMLNLLNQADGTTEIQPMTGQEMAGTEISPHRRSTSRFDMTWNAMENGNIVSIALQYSSKLFRPETIERYIRYFKTIIAYLGQPENRSHRLKEIPILSKREKEEILSWSNGEALPPEEPRTLRRRFEEQVERTPDRIVVDEENRVQLSFRQLDTTAARVARLLRKRGVKPGQTVALIMKRSTEMLIALQAIIKAGAAYLPVDPGHPAHRIDYMLLDSHVETAIIGAEGTRLEKNNEEPDTLNRMNILHMDEIMDGKSDDTEPGEGENSPEYGSPTQPAYVIYTSGSTGRPKGVLVEHRGVVNLVRNHHRVFGEKPVTRISQAASAVFDAMAAEVWPGMLAGSRICIVDDETRMSPQLVKQWIIKHQITLSFQSTQIAQMLLDEEWTGSGSALEILRTAGDRLTRYPGRKLPFRFFNLYGPTEDSVWTTWIEVPVVEGSDRHTPPAIGKPVANKSVYILNKNHRLQPRGVVGELYIHGEGLAGGYLNNPELTAEKFEQNLTDFSDLREYLEREGIGNAGSKPRLYKTGDLARWGTGGNIEFVGRIDHQVKIRGFRVETGEIESLLQKHPLVKDAVVQAVTEENTTASETASTYLCAYIVPGTDMAETGNNETELREYLSDYLPYYMIPAYMMFLDTIPLTPNGKIDRNALPEPGVSDSREYKAPRTGVEKKLTAAWTDVLGVKVGIGDSFFHVGGDSIKAIQVAARLRKQDLELKITDLFLHPRIEELANYVTHLTGNVPGRADSHFQYEIEPEKLDVVDKALRAKICSETGRDIEIDTLYPMTPMQKTMFYHSLHSRSGADSEVFYLQQMSRWQGNIDGAVLERSINELVRRHDIFRTVFEYEGLEEPLQVVLKHRDVEFRYHDISALPEEEKARRLEEIQREDIRRGFDIRKDVLIRAALIRDGRNSCYVMWSNHYIVMDGWCVGIVFRELALIYDAVSKGAAPQLNDTPPYRNYIGWLVNQDREAGFRYWKEYLAGYSHSGPLAPVQPGKQPKQGDGDFKNFDFIIEGKDIEALEQIAARNEVTMNTLFQTLWGVLLQKYNHLEDVVFGAVVSGRPPEVDGVEDMVGLFINSVPVRIRITDAQRQTFTQLLKNVQRNSTEAKAYEYLTYTEILAECGLTDNIIDNLMTYQNFVHMGSYATGADNTNTAGNGTTNNDRGTVTPGESPAARMETSLFHQSNYDFNIIITPVNPFQVRFMYNTAAYDVKFLKQIEEHFRTILRQILEYREKDGEILMNDIRIKDDIREAESSFLQQEQEEEWEF
jgi:amino acid adenylation domain-containing protein